jgi:hypothetical protein
MMMATEEELAAIDQIRNDAELKPLAEALGIVAEKEFGHMIRPRTDEGAWFGVGALMLVRLDPTPYHSLAGFYGWVVTTKQVDKLIKEHNEAGT